MKLQDLHEMQLPTYSYEDAIQRATDYARKTNDDALVLQEVGTENADQYIVIASGAYMRWSIPTREQYEIVASVDFRGRVRER